MKHLSWPQRKLSKDTRSSDRDGQTTPTTSNSAVTNCCVHLISHSVRLAYIHSCSTDVNFYIEVSDHMFFISNYFPLTPALYKPRKFWKPFCCFLYTFFLTAPLKYSLSMSHFFPHHCLLSLLFTLVLMSFGTIWIIFFFIFPQSVILYDIFVNCNWVDTRWQ